MISRLLRPGFPVPPRCFRLALSPAVRNITPWANRQKLLEQDFNNHDGVTGASRDYAEKRRLRESPTQPNGFAEAHARIKTLMASGDFEQAWDAFEAEPAGSSDIRLCTTAVQLCTKAAWPDRAWKLWSQITSKDVVLYSAMISMCARNVQPRQAVEVFNEMQAEGLKPNLITYNALVNAFSMSGEPQKAYQVFRDIPEELTSDATETSLQSLFQVAMSGWARAGNYAKCRDLFVELTTRGIKPDVRHYNALLTACAKEPHADLAQAVFDQMRSSGFTPRAESWTTLLACLRNDLPRAKAVFHDMESSGCRPTSLTYQQLLEAHVLARDGVGARELTQDLGKFGQRVESTKTRRLLEQVQHLQ